jgi:hypothetical protein
MRKFGFGMIFTLKNRAKDSQLNEMNLVQTKQSRNEKLGFPGERRLFKV